MNTTIWIIQGIVAAMFIMAGIMKSTQSKEKLEPKLPWVKDFPLGAVRLIGFAELLGGIGVIVPQAVGILPMLTSVAAAGLALTMVFAAVYHFRKQEYKAIGFNLVLLALSLVVVIFRF